MKQEQDKTNKDDIGLDSVPFSDQRGNEGHCCHDNCTCGDEADGADAGEHQCNCGKDDAQVELLAKLDSIVAENLALRDMLVRTTADFDNFRKRMVREKEEARKAANADLVSAFIPVLDTMALALDAAHKHHPEAAAVLDGIDMIMSQLKGVLKAQGVEELNPLGAAFDPNLHESLAHQPSDSIEEGKVSTVVRTGYTLNGRLLRPATVILSAGKAK